MSRARAKTVEEVYEEMPLNQRVRVMSCIDASDDTCEHIEIQLLSVNGFPFRGEVLSIDEAREIAKQLNLSAARVERGLL